jgi:protein-L-isoaspartate(D-aspartate) O-methyltransferase
MNIEQARFNMIEQQIRPWEITDLSVVELLAAVKREDFTPSAYRNLAFADTAIPLGHGAAMLPPVIEARALQALALKPNVRVLEVGTGSGYMAALLATKAENVWTVEIVPELATTARENLARAGIPNVIVEQGDGLTGLPAQAPFDAIMVSGSVPAIPQELLAQLKTGGRLFAVVGEGPAMQAQLVTRQGENQWSTQALFEREAAPLKVVGRPAFVF